MAKLSATMEQALTHFKNEGDFGSHRFTTVKALERRGLVTRSVDGGYALTEQGKSSVVVKEQIGKQRTNRIQFRWADRHHIHFPTIDVGQPDYAWWDAARRCQQPGLEIGGLFLKPLESKKTQWVLGKAPSLKYENQTTNEMMKAWWRKNAIDISTAYQDSVGLGDSYLVLNPPDENGEIKPTVVSADVVEPIVDESDYSQIIGWRITQTYQHPTDYSKMQTIEDRYYADRRERIITTSGKRRTETYRNPLGVIPVIHIPNNRGANEVFGHPEGEALLRAFQHYNEITIAGVDGNKKQGRPTPVFENMGSAENVKQFMQAFGSTTTIKNDNGTEETVTYINFTSDDAIILGEDGRFRWASPGQFAGETSILLGLLFYLILQHAEIPEFIWGNAIASSKASAESQMDPFVMWVELNQARAEKWVVQLCNVLVAYWAVYESGINAGEEVSVKWQPLTDEDGKLVLDSIALARKEGAMAREDMLSHLPLDIENPQGYVERADDEAAELRAEFEDDNPFVQAMPENDDSLDSEDTEDNGLEAEERRQMPLPIAS